VDERTCTLALNTLLLTGVTCAVSVLLGTALAALLGRTDLPGRRVGAALLGVMLFVPLYLQVAAWQAGFGVQGWFSRTFDAPAWLQGWTGAIWVHAVAAVPWVVLIVGVGMRLVERELEEQALLDASPSQVFFRVTLRRSLPALGIAALWVAVVTAREMTVTDLFVVRTYAEELYTQFALGPPLDQAPLTVLSGIVVTGGLVTLALLLCARLMARDRPIRLRDHRVFRLGPWRWPAAIVAALLLLLLIGVPLGNLCYKAGKGGGLVTSPGAGSGQEWSLWKCVAIVATSPWRYRREFGWSLGIGALAATAAVIVAVALAWLARGGKRRALPALGVTAVCLAVPGPLVGIAIIRLLNQRDVDWLCWLYDQSILAPWLALLVTALPPATLILWHALRTVPREMLDGAAVEGAGSLAQLRRIALPLCWPAVALAWVISFAVALADLGASILVVPPGVMTLSIRIFDLVHSGVEDRVAGVSLAMIVLITLLTAAATYLASVWRQDRV